MRSRCVCGLTILSGIPGNPAPVPASARLTGPEGTVVTPDSLQLSGMLRKGRDEVKVLGNGDLKVALTVQAHKFTKAAVQKIEAAGGKIELIGKPRG